MALKLTVTSSEFRDVHIERTKVFDVQGGTIGREARRGGNHWLLPDPEQVVSRLHAEIRFRGDSFWIIDHSQNGTFLDDSEEPIGEGRERPLKHGSRLQVGGYEILVTVDAANPFEEPSRSLNEPRPGPLNSVVSVDAILSSFPEQERGPWDEPEPSPSERSNASPLDAHYRPPPVESAPVAREPIPNGREPLSAPYIPPDIAQKVRNRRSMGGASARFEPQPDEPRSGLRLCSREEERPPDTKIDAQAERAESDLVRFLEAAGLDGEAARKAVRDEAIIEELGRGFGTVIRCLMETLDARSSIKREFRLPVTQHRAESNNPLKCSATPEEALARLLMGADSAYMQPREAFDEASDDIRAHQVAMMAGMRAAFRSMLSHFDPDQLEKAFEARARQSPLLRMAGKSRYWDMYKEHHQEVTGDAAANFQRLFGQQFARAYWDQMQGLDERRRR